MADYKDYIVRYDIQANMQNAVTGLKELQTIVTQLEAPMKTIATAIQDVSKAICILKQQSQITFTPSISTAEFDTQLKKMVVNVRTAASEMHAALYGALSGNPKATSAMKKGAAKALSGATSVAQIDKEIADLQKRYDKLLGTPGKNKRGGIVRKQDGDIFYAQQANMLDRVASLKGQAKAIKQRIADLQSDRIALAKLEKEEAAVAKKTAAGKKTTVTAKPQAAPQTNVTPAVIREWGKTFGNARLKNLTINIKANANGKQGAITVINEVLSSLRSLQKAASFTINPVIHHENFAIAETQLRKLATLSGKVMAPFGVHNNTKGGVKAGKGQKISGKGVAPLTVDLVGNITSITPPKTELIVPVVGEIIKLQSKVTEAIPLNAKIATGSITKSLNGKNRPTIPANIKLMWEKGAVGRQAQLKSISEKIPPIKLVLDTAPAIAKLEEFVTLVKANSPQNIALTATGSAKNSSSAAGTGRGTKGHQAAPLTPREYRDRVGKHLAKGGSLPTNYATQIADQQRIRAWQLHQMRRDAMTAFAQKTPYELAEEERLRKLAPTTAGTGRGKVVWGSQAPAGHTAPKGYKWVRANDLTSYLTPAQQQELTRLQGIESRTSQNLRDIQSRITRSTDKSNSRLSQARTQYNAIEKELAPWRQQMAQLEELKKTFTSLKKLNSSQKKALARIVAAQAPIAAQIDKLTSQQAPFAATIQHETALMARYQSMSNRAVAAAHQQQTQARSAVNQYTSGWRLSETNPKGTASVENLRKAAALQAQFHNSMLPFGLTKSQMDIVKQYRRFFRRGVAASGISPTAGMQAAQMMQYLQAVSAQMQTANIPVPIQLQSYIDKLGNQTIQGGGSGATSRGYVAPVVQKPFFDRARKWAYPFTGQTSFGARTPMAVDMAKGMGVMFAIGGAMSAIGGSFSQAMEYQNTMRTTQAILQNGTESYSQSAFQNMEATVRNVGVKTKFSAPEVANAARFLAMAGYDIDAINASIRPIADLALIGDSDLGETADKMTNIMTTFGIKPGQMRSAANIMATTATRSNTDLMMLAESAKYGGGVAQMYGRNDSNLFADTMALFGVMGNAGIQASSSGTALRMMYQNIFKPNKNQKKVLEMMKSEYGISTLNGDGSYRAMSSILAEMAQRIPENKMAEIVGNLFRITAQPGAAAALLAAAGGDQTAAQEISTGIEVMSSKMSSKAGLSSLVSLMLANRQSINGNIAGAIAEEKQNTISGLWAQVTSTFTEGIVRAFEQRQGGFEGMLKGLRDYLAKPETMAMLQNLLDMVIEIGKVMAMFVKVWAELYNMCPGMIKLWITTQMFFTQLGTLITPLIAIVGVFNRLGKVIAWISGVSSAGIVSTGRIATGMSGAANAAALNAPFIVGTSSKGKPISIRGNAAARANRAIANNATLAGELALSGADLAATRASLDNGTRQHYAAVQARAKRMYGWSRVGRAFKSGMGATFTVASMAPMFGGISKMFMGMMAGLAKAVGLLANPVTAVVGIIAGVGFGLYKLYQFANGNTKAQIVAQQRMATASDSATRAMARNYAWYTEQIDKWKHPSTLVEATPKSETQVKLEEQNKQFKEENADIIADLTKDASYKAIDHHIQSWRNRVDNNLLVRFAMGKQYDQLVGDGLAKNNSLLPYGGTDADFGTAIYNILFGAKNHAKEVQNKRIKAALRAAGAGDPAIFEASNRIAELRQQYLDKSISQSEYFLQARAVRDSIVSKASLSDPTLKSSVGMSLEDFNNISDPSVYREYQIGRYNVLTSLINGAEGSIVGKMNADYNLHNGIKAYSDQWWSAIRQVIGNFPVTMQVITEKGVETAEDIIVQMMPDGKTIDYNNIITQVTNKVGKFHQNLQDFANMTATVYQKLVEAGYISQEEAGSLTWKSIEHQTLTKNTLVDYYNTLPASHPWKQAHKTAEEYANFVSSPNSTILLGNHTFQSGRERVYIRRQLANRAKNNIITAAKKTQEQAEKLKNKTSSEADGTSDKSNPTGTPSPISNTGTQDAYASHYDKTTARPTVVNINIGELAHFDRTSVASSAQERDLLAAMEEKIAESIYRLSMTAFSNLSGYTT